MNAKLAFASAFISLTCLTLATNSYSLDAKIPSSVVTLIADPTTPICPNTTDPHTFSDRLLSDGSRVPFTIPTGQVLVITSYDWVIEGSTEANNTVWTGVAIFNGPNGVMALSSGARADSIGRAAGNSIVPNGVVVKPGKVMCFNYVGGAANLGTFARIHGFLTEDR